MAACADAHCLPFRDGAADCVLCVGSVANYCNLADLVGELSRITSRGAALADFNLDGLLDLVVVNRWEAAQVWRNVSKNAGGWIAVKIEQPGVNRDAIGSWLEVKRGSTVMRREITVGGGHASGQSGWWHFGLGSDTAVSVRVIWPDGIAAGWQSAEPDNFYVIERGKPPRLWLAK